MKLDGKVAIVTGAGSGIGREIALVFAKEGAAVIIAEIDLTSAEEAINEIKSLGGQAQAIKTDVSIREEVHQLVGKALDAYGEIDILVNNAGNVKLVPAEEITDSDWDSMIDVNLKGVFLCCQEVGREMIKRKQGKIVNISTTATYRGLIGGAAYSASKGGVHTLTKVLAVEWAKYNINVNSVSPGTTLTPILAKAAKGDLEAFINERAKAIPQKRLIKPEDVASTVLFLSSSESDVITGVDILIDGGTSAVHPGDVPKL